MILDLITPWSTVLAPTSRVSSRTRWLSHHATLLEAIRRERSPLMPQLNLCNDASRLAALAQRVGDQAWQAQLRADLTTLADLGLNGCSQVVLIAGDGTGEVDAAIPALPAVVLFLESAPSDTALRTALALAVARVTRLRGLRARAPASSDTGLPGHWQRARDTPLREWVYATGLGLHAARALMPTLPVHQLLRMSAGAYRRLRERSAVLQALIARDLDESGVGLLLRWADPAATTAMRRRGNVVIPPGAGPYLAWKMTAPRVARVGLPEATRMEA